MKNHNLVDFWRDLNPHKVQFSRHQRVQGVLKQSRIDYALIATSALSSMTSIDYIISAVSDHSLLSISLFPQLKHRNGGVWCFNNSLLNDPLFIKKITHFLKLIPYELTYTEDIFTWWEKIKQRIKKLSINFSKHKNWLASIKEKQLQLDLEHELTQISHNPDHDLTNYITLKEKLSTAQKSRCMGAIIRSRVQMFVEGEKCTAYFLGLEKHKQKNSHINEIKDENGNLRKHPEEIQTVVYSFFQNLFSSQPPPQNEINQVLNNIQIKLQQHDKEWCDQPLTAAEIDAAICGLKKNKSPGIDGLTTDFYYQFRDLLTPILARIFTAMDEHRCTPETFTRGLITLVYKNKGDRASVQNYRPISLLNTDYKILMKCFANKLKTVIPQLVNQSQAYSIPGRDISDPILSLKTAFKIMSLNGGILFSADFEKAFDRVEHNFIWATMHKFGFGEKFIQRIQLPYSNMYSQVKINGLLTPPIKIDRSIRQGCPLSSLLYSLIAEPLAAQIKNSPKIIGICDNKGSNCKHIAYADDTTLVIKDNDSLDEALAVIHSYCRASGAKLNQQKSSIMYCGGMVGSPSRWPFKEEKGCVKVLGVYLGNSEEVARDKTWGEVIGKIKNTLGLWKGRKLTLRGKVVLINSLILSRINHVLSVYDLPSQTLIELKNIISTFLWGSRINMIAHRTMINKHTDGGLKLLDITTKKHAFRLKIIKKVLDKQSNLFWKNTIIEELESIGNCGLHNLCQIPPILRTIQLSPFTREVLDAWRLIRSHLTMVVNNRTQLLQVPAFHNPDITHCGRPVSGGPLPQVGINTLGDLTNTQGEIVLSDILKRLGRCKRYEKQRAIKICETISTSMPEPFKQAFFTTKGRMQDDTLDFHLSAQPNPKSFTSLTTKYWYKTFLEKFALRPTSEQKWKELFPTFNIASIWSNITSPFSHPSAINTDFKLRHRRIFTGVVLHKIWEGSFGRDCAVCGLGPETLHHLFLSCPICVSFISRVRSLLDHRCHFHIQDEQQWNWVWLFGITSNSPGVNRTLINLLLSLARHTVYISRNHKLYGNRTINHWSLFISLAKSHLRLLHAAYGDIFVETFTTWNTLLRMDNSNKLFTAF